MDGRLARGSGVLSLCGTGELEEFSSYLVVVRGVVTDVAVNYVRWVREFVVGLTGQDGLVDWARADGAAANLYVARRGQGYARKTVGGLVTAVRSLLRWAYQTGRVRVRSDLAVLSPADWQGSQLPRALTGEQQAGVLGAVGAFERTVGAALRDRAAVLLLCRLGLRAGEVAGLRLEDVDWRAGLVTVRGKGRSSTLPLPVDVGAALVAYLKDGRPRGVATRRLFLTEDRQGPTRPWSASGVTQMVGRAARVAGLGVIHAHRLRHTAATRVLAEGGSLADVAQLLGHSRIQTAAIYAKSDLRSLRTLVVAWGTVARP